VFATRDLSRMLVYDINPTGDRDGTETPYVQNMAAAAFDPALFVPTS
jgi:D-alanyl-D-alanine carboxypeptidase